MIPRARKKSLNFLAPISLEECRRQLSALHDQADEEARLEVSLHRHDDKTWWFVICRVPHRRSANDRGVMFIDGFLKRMNDHSTHVIGKLKGDALIIDDITPRELVVKLSLLIILTYGSRFVIGDYAFGVVGLTLALGFVAWKVFLLHTQRNHLLQQVESALAGQHGKMELGRQDK